MLNIIVNPYALRGKGGKILERTEQRLKREEVPYHIFRSEKKGAVTLFAKSLTEAGEKNIIAFGGDGTVNEALSGLYKPEEVTFGIIPAGTGNDFAAAANIPFGEKALDLILYGEAKPTDYIQFSDGRRSLNITGLGIDVDILERYEARKQRGKRGSYFRSLLSSLRHFEPIELSVTADGERKEYTAMIAALCNGSRFGGGIKICPTARIDDGKIELIVVDCPKRSKMLIELIYLMRGKILKRPIVHHLLCDEVIIEPKKACSAQYDGEIKPCESLHGNIVHGALKMFRG